METQTLITIIFSSSITTFLLGWIKDLVEENTIQKRKRLELQEEAYRELMRCSDFIYAGNITDVLEKKDKFIQNYRLLFLHAPDVVILKINNFLEVMSSDVKEDDSKTVEKKKTIADSLLSLRKQFMKRTKLNSSDYKHII